MVIKEQFSRFAKEYEKRNIIQKKVVQKLASMIPYKNLIDLGCGNGALCRSLDSFDHIIAVDFSQKMLDLHPRSSKISLIEADFNQKECFENIQTLSFDAVVSASALQWSENLSFVFDQISGLKKPFFLALFTSNTFKTLHEVAGINSPIHSSEDIIESADKAFLNYKREVLRYELRFDSTLEMLRYIKHSGVSGGVKKLTYKEVNYLLKTYPKEYLEFEVIIITG